MRVGTTDNHPDRKPHPLRRQYIVNRTYQGRFVASLCCITAIVGIVAGCAVHTSVKNALEDAMYRMHLPTNAVWTIIRTPLVKTNVILASVSIILAVVAVMIVTRTSSRALRAIEREVQAIDTPHARKPAIARTSLWQGVPESAPAGLRDRMRPFGRAADELEEAAQDWAGRKTIAVAECVQLLDKAIAEIEQGCEAFEC
jgi:hypothetical protein